MPEEQFVKSPAFQTYPADFLSDKNTLVMTTTEIGAYWLLLLVCWQENGLPDDLAELAAVARLPLKQFQPMWERRIARCFQKRDDGRWTHKRLEKERNKQAEHRERQSAAGKRGADKRWQSHSHPIATPSNGNGKTNAIAMAKDSSSFSSSSSTVVEERGYPFDHFAVLEYEQTLRPDPGLAIRQAELIADAVADSPESRAAWRDVLKIFTGNDYNPRHAGNALDRYQKEMAKIESGERSPIPIKLSAADRERKENELRERMTGHARTA